MHTDLSVKQFIELKQLQQSHHAVKEKWCEEQLKDIEKIVEMVNDIVINSISCMSSSQAYEQLEESKAVFMKTLIEMSENYRHI